MYYNGFRKKRINISMNETLYVRARRRIGEGSFSALMNELTKDWLVRDKEREAKRYLEERGYKVTKT